MDAVDTAEEIRSRKALAIIETDEEESSYYVLTEFENSTFSLTASNGVKTWAGKVSHKEVKAMASRAEMLEDSFLDEMLKALTRENVGNMNFAYNVHIAPNDSLELTFKRHLVADNIRFQLGTVRLLPQPPNRAHACLLRYAVGTISDLKGQLAEASREKVRLSGERQLALDRLEQCANLKEDIERELFGRFKEVLNTKKNKIRTLSEELARASEKSARPSSSSVPEPGEVDAREHSSDRTSGEEDCGVRTPPAPASSSAASRPAPGSHADPTPLSLLDDVADRGGSFSPPAKRRRVHQPGGRPLPGKRPSIPKPPPAAAPPQRATAEPGKARANVAPPAGEKRVEQSLGSDELLGLL